MAAGDLAAKRYAQAAFELAQAANATPQWQEALDRIAAFMSGSDASHFLEASRVSQEAKQNLVDAALGDLPPLPLNLARLLVRKGRTALASEIAEQFQRLSQEQRGIEHVKAVTAVPLSESEQQNLNQSLSQRTGHEIILETAVEPDLLGGIVVQIGDRLFDASTRARLNALRRALA